MFTTIAGTVHQLAPLALLLAAPLIFILVLLAVIQLGKEPSGLICIPSPLEQQLFLA